jgi:hypothetical protein
MDSTVNRNLGLLFDSQLSLNWSTILPISIKRIELSLEDDIIGISPFGNDISMNDFDAMTSAHFQDFTDSAKIIIYVSNDSHYVYQGKRRVLNILEIFGTLGGVFQVFDIFFGVILGSLSTFMFKKELKKEV